jgi:threonine synthase
MINEAYSAFLNESILPVEHLENNHYLMQEFYGPTASFKDLALQLFPRLFQESLKNYDEKMVVLVATSGDTGSAVLSGFKEIGLPVIVLYPYGKVSLIQEAQMVTAEGNVSVLGVNGDFDFCQTAVKDIFNDTKFSAYLRKEHNLNLSSANSINWGRLLPQVCYSINSYLELVKVFLNFNIRKIK